MIYKEDHPRRVIGLKVHETMEEHTKKKKKAKSEETNMISEPTFEFLVPDFHNFVETEQVSKIIERVVKWTDTGYSPHLIGPTGCGKTTLALAVARKMGQPILWLNGDDQMTTGDLIGGYSEVERSVVIDKYIHNVVVAKDKSKYIWVDNPLTIACKYGYTLIYNEFSRAKPIANNVLLSVLEEGILELPLMFGAERYVRVHPHFSVIFTSNSIEYAGVHRPQDALLDRMVHIYMGYYDFPTELGIVMKHTGLSDEAAGKVVAAVRQIRDKMPLESKPGTRAAIMVGLGLRVMMSREFEDIQQVYLDVLSSKIYGPEPESKYTALVGDVLRDVYGETQ